MGDVEITEDELKLLTETCAKAKDFAHVPYSKFRVGAAVLSVKDGKVFSGCNVENASYPMCTCAERVAITKAVSEGYTKFKAIAVTSDMTDGFCYPCGGCRQVIVEFGLDTKVILTKPNNELFRCTARDLMPYSFTNEALDAKRL